MPLSEHEQRLLDQMERALYAEDPKFATQLRGVGQSRATRGRAVLGVLGILLGLGAVLAGVATELIALGVAGFAVMLMSAVLAIGAFRQAPAAAGTEEPVAEGKASKPAKPGFMDRMEDRWRRRSDEGGDF